MTTAGGPLSESQSRRALIAGVACYLLWGATPILFMALGHAGADEWEIVGHRADVGGAVGGGCWCWSLGEQRGAVAHACGNRAR